MKAKRLLWFGIPLALLCVVTLVLLVLFRQGDDGDAGQQDGWRQPFYDTALEAIASPKAYPVTSICLYDLADGDKLMLLEWGQERELWRYDGTSHRVFEGHFYPLGTDEEHNLVVQEAAWNEAASANDNFLVLIGENASTQVLGERAAGSKAYTMADGSNLTADPAAESDPLADAGLYTPLPEPRRIQTNALVWVSGDRGPENEEWLSAYPTEGDPDPVGILAEIFGLREYRAEDAPEWLRLTLAEMRQHWYFAFVPANDAEKTNGYDIVLGYIPPAAADAHPIVYWGNALFPRYCFAPGGEAQTYTWEGSLTFYTDGEACLAEEINEGNTAWYRLGADGFQPVATPDIAALRELQPQRLETGPVCWQALETALLNEFA